MADPITVAAVAYGRRVLLKRIARFVAWLSPLLVAAAFTILVYGSVIVGGSGTDAALAPASVCTTLVSAPADGGAPDELDVRLDEEQLANAATIAAVGRHLAVPPRGILIALATALQESTLHNIPYGDRDSIGLFQQRDPWGPRADRLNPATASQMFYTGGQGGQPGLLSIAGWESMPVTVAAQAVQRSAFPDAYARWEGLARQLMSMPRIAAAACTHAATVGGNTSIVDAAMRWIGTPYSWGGGALDGPSYGIGIGSHTLGFDCSGLTRYAVYTSTGRILPRVATDQAATLTPVSESDIQAGDLLFFHQPGDPQGVFHHVGIANGKGGMVHAPSTGGHVEVVPDVVHNGYFAPQLAYVGRVSL